MNVSPAWKSPFRPCIPGSARARRKRPIDGSLHERHSTNSRLSAHALGRAGWAAGSLLNRHGPLEEYARELRWLEYCRRWALPVAGGLATLIVIVLLSALSVITYALLHVH